jgi:hypothetical protein
VATTQQLAKGFDAKWRKHVLQEARHLANRTHERKQ